jgi:hypothetical protein
LPNACVTGRSKIQIAGALFLLGALAIPFAFTTDPPLLITYVGAAAHGTNNLLCVITNKSSNILLYRARWEGENGVVAFGGVASIADHSEQTVALPSHGRGRWRILVDYTRPADDTFTGHIRLKAEKFLNLKGLYRMASWIQPRENFTLIQGPEMIDDHPARTVSK